jgi:2-dehydro-3-deoxyphosphooctonate aldolase (KDO 8-P synthase)
VSKSARVGSIEIGPGLPLVLVAGPCALESLDIALRVADDVSRLCRRLGVPYVFKSSYLKDNRTAPGSYAGPGLDEGLRSLAAVRERIGVPVLSDIHERSEITAAAEVLDALQIPAFLCRQTRLVREAARTGKPLNLKKGQFMAPDDMVVTARKALDEGNENVLLTERGSSFGYHDLVVDLRGIGIMRDAGYPVVFDATHSVQRPGGAGGVSGGSPEFVPLLARAAVAAGCDALFIETHPDPRSALSDAHSMVPLEALEPILTSALAVAQAVGRPSGERT